MKHIEPLFNCTNDQTLDIMLQWVEDKLRATMLYRSYCQLDLHTAKEVLETYYLMHFK